MTITKVNEWEGSEGTSAGPSHTLSFTPTSGNLLVVVLGHRANSSITGLAGFTEAVEADGNSNESYLLWKVSDGTETTLSFTVGSSAHWAVKVAEFSGVDTSVPIDKSGVDVVNMGTVLNPVASAVGAGGFGFAFTFQNATDGTMSFTDSYVKRHETTIGSGTGGSGGSTATVADKATTSTSVAEETTATYSGSSGRETAIIAVLKEDAPPVADNAFEQALLDKSVQHYWPVDEVVGGKIHDKYGGVDLTVVGAPSQITGPTPILTGALRFDGVDDAASAAAPTYVGPITVLMFVRTQALGQNTHDEAAFNSADTSRVGCGAFVQDDVAGTDFWEWHGSNDLDVVYDLHGDAVVVDQWEFFATTIQASGARFYQNNSGTIVLKDSDTAGDITESDFQVFRLMQGRAEVEFGQHDAAALAIFRSALTLSEIQAIYDASQATNYDETGRLVSVAGTVASADQLDMVEAGSMDGAVTLVAVDSSHASEGASVSATGTVVAADSLAMNETALAITGTAEVVAADSVGMAESAVVGIAATVGSSDVLALTEAGAISIAATVGSTDSMASAEAGAVDIAATVAVADSLAATEVVSIVAAATVTSSDVLNGGGSAYDETGRLVSIAATVSAADALAATENVAHSVSATVTATDVLTATETAATEAVGTVASTDLLTSHESLAVEAVATVGSSDVLNGGGTNYDETGRSIVASGTVASEDSLGVTEGVSIEGTVTVANDDSLGATETASVTVTASVSSADLLGLTDTMTVDITGQVSSSDAATALETLVAEVAGTVGSTDTLGAIEELVVGITATVSSSDFLNPTAVEAQDLYDGFSTTLELVHPNLTLDFDDMVTILEGIPVAYTIKEGATAPPVSFVVKRNGSVVSLSTAVSVKLRGRHDSGDSNNDFEVTCTVDDAAAGACSYAWQAGDLVKGAFAVDVKVTWSDSTVEFIPNDTYAEVRVLEAVV